MNNNTVTILVTGANGQLGLELHDMAPAFPAYHFIFTTKEELPIDDFVKVSEYFYQHQIDYCINCAAYTAVDKAETEKEKAFLINGDAVGHLATTCKVHDVILIHISTDYVFDGTATKPYSETSATNPINIYGASKLKGEMLALQNNPSTIIIRSSWVYSQYGSNFVKTMLRLMKERESINVVNDQFGCPTYARDLAKSIIEIVSKLKSTSEKQPTVFNYCNGGSISWFDFAREIKEITGNNCKLIPITTHDYPTAAKRPQYSVLDTMTIREKFQIVIPQWKESLKTCLSQM